MWSDRIWTCLSRAAVTILGTVAHLAWVKEGKVIDYAVPDEDMSYEDIVVVAADVLENSTSIKVRWWGAPVGWHGQKLRHVIGV
ncbi:MAG: hypothetical protein APF80_13395 [Alphaproteobacteria bacterium BRH_c36]|nr:MAG: hypothetical protein APF80_13395 [Alphaproteobacteria bacterium BRH_c36]